MYNGDWDRTKRTASGTNTRFLVDTNNPTNYSQVFEERDEFGGLLRVYGYGVDLHTQWDIQAETMHYYGYDAIGSTRQLTDGTGGATDAYQYDAYGSETSHYGTTSNAYRYAGE